MSWDRRLSLYWKVSASLVASLVRSFSASLKGSLYLPWTACHFFFSLDILQAFAPSMIPPLFPACLQDLRNVVSSLLLNLSILQDLRILLRGPLAENRTAHPDLTRSLTNSTFKILAHPHTQFELFLLNT